jgi:hypothetical protein
MKSLLISIFIFFPVFAFSQVFVSGVDINKIDSVKICQITVSGFKNLGGISSLSLDYGQPDKKSLNQITSAVTGKKMKFNSVVHVLNFMENNGWIHYDSQSVLFGNENDRYLYFRKRQ